jgi:hypothetical protein
VAAAATADSAAHLKQRLSTEISTANDAAEVTDMLLRRGVVSRFERSGLC